MIVRKIVLAGLLCAVALKAQPAIRSGGVVNAASYASSSLPNGNLAQGSQFAIIGTGLGPAEPVQAAGFPYPAADGLGGVTVKVTSGGTTADAIMVSVSDKKVVAVLPSSVPAGSGQVTLSYDGKTATADVRVVATSFGIFTRSQSGSGAAVLKNVGGDGTLADNTLTTPAGPGQSVTMQGTGLGGVSGDEAAGPLPGDIPVEVEVFVGGKPAKVTAKGRAECCAGVDQITFETPEGALGCSVPVAVRAGGVVSNFATMSVSAGGVCSDPSGFSARDLEKLQAGGNYSTGTITLSRSSIAVEGFESITDSGSAGFLRFRAEDLLNASGPGGYPSLGSCIVITSFDVVPVSTPFTMLDAGPALTVNGPKGAKEMKKDSGVYSANLGTALIIPQLPMPPQTYLDAGSYTVTGPGGADIGAFTARLTIGQPLNWTNRATVGNSGPDAISRSGELTPTWTGGTAGDFVTITGASSLAGGRTTVIFICIERATAGRFTVPSWVLSALPPSEQGFLSLGLSPLLENSRFEAPGLDAGFIWAASSSMRTIAYR